MPPKTAQTKKPRGRPSVFSEDQLEFLGQYTEAYNGLGRVKGEEFWNGIFPKYFERWPLPEVSVDLSLFEGDAAKCKAATEKARQDQRASAREKIKSWFARCALKTNRQEFWRKQLTQALCPKKNKPRPFTEKTMFKFYGKMDEYRKKVEDQVSDTLANEGRAAKPEENVARWCTAAKALWDLEPEDVRESVCEAAAVDFHERTKAWERGQNETIDEESQAEARENLVGAVEPFVGELCRIAGFATGMFLGGLPAGEDSHDVKCYDVHHGQTSLIRGAKFYPDHDPIGFQSCIRSFATFTDHCAGYASQAAIEAAPGKLADDRLLSMTPFEDSDGIETPSTRASGAPLPAGAATNRGAVAQASSLQATGPGPSSQSTPAVRPAPGADTRPVRPTNPTRLSTAAAPSVQPTPPSEDAAPSSPRIEEATPLSEGLANASKARRRPKPKPVTYDVPATFSTMLVKDFTLNNALRALLQRMPASERANRLRTMDRWQIGSLKRANSLAQANAELGGSNPGRDRATLKDIFKSWEDAPRGATSGASDAQAAASKRKRSTQEDDDADYESECDDEGAATPTAPRRSSRRSGKSATSSARSGAALHSPASPPSPSNPQTPPPNEQSAASPASGGSAAPTSCSPSRSSPTTGRIGLGPSSQAGAGQDPLEGEGANGEGRVVHSEREHDIEEEGRISGEGATLSVGGVEEEGSATREGDASAVDGAEGEGKGEGGGDGGEGDSDAGGVGRGGGDTAMHEETRTLTQHMPTHLDPEQQRDARSLHHGGRRGSVAPAPPSIFDIEFRKGLPAWVQNCFDNVETLEGGEDIEGFDDARDTYLKIVELWAAIEETNGYRDSGRALSSQNRPSFVGAWIGRARRATYVPDLLADQKAGESDDDAANAAYDTFRDDMRLWWHHINPKWRLPTATFALERGEGDWSSLFCSGKNGLVSVVKCVKWWWDLLDDVDEEDDDRDEWRLAVEEVAWVFEQVLSQKRLLQRRSPGKEANEPPAKRRKT